jgi:hypothetical protein
MSNRNKNVLKQKQKIKVVKKEEFYKLYNTYEMQTMYIYKLETELTKKGLTKDDLQKIYNEAIEEWKSQKLKSQEKNKNV